MDSIRNLMDKLWQKDSNDDLIELLPDLHLKLKESYESFILNAPHRFLDNEFKPEKCDRVSADFREHGNEMFNEGKWRAAMELYNQSLRFAVDGSENVSLAYANRSECFWHMQKYIECLNDIAMAKENGYPKRLMEKLNEREANCLEKLKNGHTVQADTEPKLSFDPHEHFPCLANVLEIQSNNEFGRHIVAKCDIDVGQTVFLEEAFVCGFDASDRTLCSTCLKAVKNFIPCQNCTDAMFCDEKCMETNEIHKITCASACNREASIQILVHSIVYALNAFSTIENLMNFVEMQMASVKFDLPEKCLDAREKYSMFLKLNTVPMEPDQIEIAILYLAYRCILTARTINAQFNSKRKQHFLQHLIWQHALILKNTFVHALKGDSGTIQVLGIIQSLFNHSCIPNLHIVFVQNKRCGITVRPVKKGEQLYITYSGAFWDKSTEDRKQYLLEQFKFECECARCMPKEIQTKDEAKISSNQIFQFILANCSTNHDGNHSNLKEKCYEFMKKFGYLESSKEIGLVTWKLILCIQKDYPEYLENIFKR